VRGKMEVIKRKLHLGVRAYVRFLHAGWRDFPFFSPILRE
jgi:hypothetical protein